MLSIRNFLVSLPAFACMVPAAAFAQSEAPQSDSRPAGEQPSTIASLPEKNQPAPANPYQRFDDLSLKGWDTPYPRIGDTLLGQKFGVRDALADYGIGIFGLSTNGFIYNVGDHGAKGPQAYNGQKKVTYFLGVQSLFLTLDASRVGIDGGQFFINFTSSTNGFERVDGPRDTRISNLGYYQSLAGGAVEIKAGIFDNNQEYGGTSVGGSIAAGNLGPQSRIPVQVGLSYGAYGTPAVNMRLNFKDHLYTKFGVERSTPPGGAANELPHNRLGLQFSVPGADALFIDEIGYNRPSSPGVKSQWFRAGAIYNTTNFTSFRTGKEVDNWAVYGAYDRQLTQPDQHLPFRGVYVGATYDKAPSDQNLYTQYVEGRVYGVGLIKSRPFDLLSFVATYNGLSKAALAAIAQGQPTHDKIYTATVSYAYHLTNGLYVQPGLGVTIHPSYYPRQPNALNTYLNVTALF